MCVGGGKRGVGGEEMDFFWDYKMTYKVRFQTIDSGNFVVCWEMSVHSLRTHAERPPWGQKKVAVMGEEGFILFWSRTCRNMFIVLMFTVTLLPITVVQSK